MKNSILGIAVISMFASGCAGKYVVRNADTMRANIAFTNQLVQQSQSALESMISRQCSCDSEGKWVRPDSSGAMVDDQTCNQAAEIVVVTRARWTWHTEMTMFLNGFTEERPSAKPPEIPANSVLCEELNNGE